MEYYFIGSLSVGIVSYLSIHRPILKELKATGELEQDEFRHPMLTATILITLFTVLAPFMVLAGVFTSNAQFQEYYKERLLDKEK
jgi:hypothetical protein